MKRQIIHIDEDLCDGCGDCVPSCAEGAIQVIDGKARLVKDALCDGLGACLGECPQGALTIEERDADEFDDELVEQHLQQVAVAGGGGGLHVVGSVVSSTGGAAHGRGPGHGPGPGHGHGPGLGGGGGCPGARMINFASDENGDADADGGIATGAQPSTLRQWPVQLHLVSPMAPYFQGADVLLAADCVAFAMGNFHRDYLKGKGLAIACPKLDDGQEVYLDKLVAMIDQARINTLTVMIMQVPCCGGLAHLAQQAVARAARKVPVKQIVVGLQGEILDEQWI
jgi:NAD-dependent dihydropyrimidine dehydrogenase PreA subunit